MPYGEDGLWYDGPPPPIPGGPGSGGASGGTGTPDPYYAPPEPGEWFNPFVGPPVLPPEASQPPTPDPGPPVAQPPPIGFDPTPAPPFVDGGAPGPFNFGALWSPFFRPGRTRRLPSPFEQFVRTTTSEAVKGLRDYFGKPPPNVRGPNPFPMPWGRKPSSWWMLPGLGALSGVVIGLTFNRWNRLGSGELTLEQRMEVWRNGVGEMLPTGKPPLQPPYVDPFMRPGDSKAIQDALAPLFPAKPDDYIPQDRTVPWWVKPAVRAVAPALEPFVRAYQDVGPPSPKRDISPARNVAPTPEAVTPQVGQVTLPPRSTTGKSARSSRRNRIFTFGGLGTLLLLVEANRRSGGSTSAPSMPPSTAPSPTTPSTPFLPTPTLTPLVSASVGSYYSSGGDGYCVPRPRGPRRKCLERAPVKYSGGRRKGKAAGTKCLRWEGRKR